MIVSPGVTLASIAWSTYPRDRRAPKTPSELPGQVRVPEHFRHDIPRIRVLNRVGSGGLISILTMSFKPFSKRHFGWGETRLHEHIAVFALFFGTTKQEACPSPLFTTCESPSCLHPNYGVWATSQHTLLGSRDSESQACDARPYFGLLRGRYPRVTV